MVDKARNETVETLRRVPCEVYSRIVGYLRPVRDWNQGKKQEFIERKTYEVTAEPPTGTNAEPKP